MSDLLVGSGAINLVVAVLLAAWHRARVAPLPAPAAAAAPPPGRPRGSAPRGMSAEEIETQRLERELSESFSRFSDPAGSSARGRDFRDGARRAAASSMRPSVARPSQPASHFVSPGGSR
ncbi:MAG: hypothetical protein HY049_07745 [Acidobacteria bacterium]|nr:hypothetical protein [Acidobacteriota bacterium]